MSKYILVIDDDDYEDVIFTNKDDLIAQMASWLNMRVIKK